MAKKRKKGKTGKLSKGDSPPEGKKAQGGALVSSSKKGPKRGSSLGKRWTRVGGKAGVAVSCWGGSGTADASGGDGGVQAPNPEERKVVAAGGVELEKGSGKKNSIDPLEWGRKKKKVNEKSFKKNIQGVELVGFPGRILFKQM